MSAHPRVLIVDDNPDILILLRTNLRASGFEPIQAENGEVALRMILEERPDLVLLDLMMPVMDGWGVLEALEGREDLPPIVVVSASDANANLERAEKLGVTAYVTKPFDLVAVVDLVRTLTRPRDGAGLGADPS